jgi:hypothetical protein
MTFHQHKFTVCELQQKELKEREKEGRRERERKRERERERGRGREREGYERVPCMKTGRCRQTIQNKRRPEAG